MIKYAQDMVIIKLVQNKVNLCLFSKSYKRQLRNYEVKDNQASAEHFDIEFQIDRNNMNMSAHIAIPIHINQEKVEVEQLCWLSPAGIYTEYTQTILVL